MRWPRIAWVYLFRRRVFSANLHARLRAITAGKARDARPLALEIILHGDGQLAAMVALMSVYGNDIACVTPWLKKAGFLHK